MQIMMCRRRNGRRGWRENDEGGKCQCCITTSSGPMIILGLLSDVVGWDLIESIVSRVIGVETWQPFTTHDVRWLNIIR